MRGRFGDKVLKMGHLQDDARRTQSVSNSRRNTYCTGNTDAIELIPPIDTTIG